MMLTNSNNNNAPFQISSRAHHHPESRVLGEHYLPQQYDVICAKGRRAACHFGNIVFRDTIELHLERYQNAMSKLDKSIIVIEIVDEIRSRTLGGGFIQKKKDPSNGNKTIWVEIGDTMARSKVGHAIRDTMRKKHGIKSVVAAGIAACRTTISCHDDAMSNEVGSTRECDNNAQSFLPHTREGLRQLYDESALLRISLISISGIIAFDDEQLLSDDEDCSLESFIICDTLASFQTSGAKDEATF